MHACHKQRQRPFPSFNRWTIDYRVTIWLYTGTTQKIYCLALKYGNMDVQTAIIYKGFTVHHFSFSGMTILFSYVGSNVWGFFLCTYLILFVQCSENTTTRNYPHLAKVDRYRCCIVNHIYLCPFSSFI